MRFTREVREKIVSDFTRRHNGLFDPKLFLDEVREKGAEHPAFEWFEWDADKAALAYQVEQARQFVRDLRVSFKIEEVGRGRAISVRETAAPLVISPVNGRRKGGGYFVFDPENAEHMEEHRAQAAAALRAWLVRYEAACVSVGADVRALNKAIALLEQKQKVANAA